VHTLCVCEYGKESVAPLAGADGRAGGGDIRELLL
jgi:hypothetical protein